MRFLVKAGSLVEYLRGSLWFVPALAVVLAGLIGGLLLRVTPPEGSLLGSLAFQGGAQGAGAILRAVATSVITVTTLVFTLTVLTLQLASQQFSPRLLRTFLREGRNQAVLAVFLATFVYSLVVLLGVRSGSTRGEHVPGLAVTGALVLVLASVAALVAFIGHITNSVRIDALMKQVEDDTRSVIDALHPNPCRAEGEQAPPVLPGEPVPVLAGGSGFLTAVAPRTLERLALRHDLVLVLALKVGERVVQGGDLVLAWPRREGDDPPEAEALAAGVNEAVEITFERTTQQDVAYGLRQLVDVAVKGLSPAVNDPTTAVHAIGHLASILCILAGRDLSPLTCKDGDGDVRVVVGTYALREYLDLACRQIRLYGARDSVVGVALLEMLRDVGRCARGPEHRRAVRDQALMVLAAAEREIVEPHDLEAVRNAATAVEREAGDGNFGQRR